MKEKKVQLIVGVSVAALFLVAVAIFLFNLNSEVKVQRVQQVKPIESIISGRELEKLLKHFVAESGGVIQQIDLSYDQKAVTVDLSETWDSMKDDYKENAINKFGRNLVDLYQKAGIKSIRVVKFYDQFSAFSQDYFPRRSK
jgi:hypothetical protein